jgi:GTP-binding protein
MLANNSRFTVAIVGRPNVGKSTLFNRLAGKRLALVHDEPGVTRDRREGEARIGDLSFTAIDTAGFEEAKAQSLSGRMRGQTQSAIASADAVLFLIDARSGIVPVDRAFADLLRKSGKPVIVVANKSEGAAAEAGVFEAHTLGLGPPVALSAEHGEGLAELYERLAEVAPPAARAASEARAPAAHRQAIRVAVVGRPNSGKSTLINRLLGEERLLTGPEAGITRDAIAVSLEWQSHRFRLFDTAGLRRRSRVEAKLEKLSVADALNAVRFAEVVIVLMDAEKPFEEQDLRIADLVEREGRAIVLAISKSDLLAKRPKAADLREQADHWLPQVKGVAIAAVSALTGEGVDRLMQAVVDAHEVWNRRIPTNALNTWLKNMLTEHPPPAVAGRRLKLNYITQSKARPPTIVLFGARTEAVPEGYRRYLINGLREAFDLPGTPIRLVLREKANPFVGKKPARRRGGKSQAGGRNSKKRPSRKL